MKLLWAVLAYFLDIEAEDAKRRTATLRSMKWVALAPVEPVEPVLPEDRAA